MVNIYHWFQKESRLNIEVKSMPMVSLFMTVHAENELVNVTYSIEITNDDDMEGMLLARQIEFASPIVEGMAKYILDNYKVDINSNENLDIFIEKKLMMVVNTTA